jgi:hypothetical protein
VIRAMVALSRVTTPAALGSADGCVSLKTHTLSAICFLRLTILFI